MRSILIIASLLIGSAGVAQQSFSLQQAMEYAAIHSYQTQLSEQEVLSAKAKVNETIGSGLPQINANGSYQNFIKQPVQIVPAEFFGGNEGEFASVVFGTKQNLTADITATQLIFDGSYLVGLKAAQQVAKFFELQQEKSINDVKKEVADAYFMALVAQRSNEILKESLDVFEKLKKDRRAMYEEGFASETDADQMDINYNNLKANVEYTTVQKNIAIMLLKFRMGIKQNQEIVLTDPLDNYTQSLPVTQNEVNLKNTVDFQLATQNITLQNLNRKALQAQYLPSLNGFFTHQQQSYSNNFNFFGSEATYYPSTIFGVNIKIPIFSSLNKHYKIKQAKIEEFKAKITTLQVREGLILDYKNAEANLIYNFNNFKNQESNLQLAKRIQHKTLIKFKEGMASSFEVSQSESQFLDAQNTYTQATLNYLQSITKLKQVTNQF
jgi:outer membrane protein TolC